MYTPSENNHSARRTARLRGLPLAGKITAAGAVTVVALGAAVGIAAAGEESPEPAPYEPAPGEIIEVVDDGLDGWAGLEVPEPTEDDLRIQDEFDRCLTDNGVPPADPVEPLADGAEAPEPASIEIDDAVLDVCMPILEDLSTWNWLQGGEEMPMPELVEIRDDESSASP